MTYTVVPDKATASVFTEVNWDTHIRDNLNRGVPRPIIDTVLTAEATSITFNAIPADYAHLLILAYVRDTAATIWTGCDMRLNGDSGANYDFQMMQGFGSTPSNGETLAFTAAALGLVPAGNAVANSFGAVCAWIGHYAGTTNNKSYVATSSAKYQNASNGLVWRSFCGHWRSNAAVTSITLIPSTDSFAVGTKATLYGMGL